MNIIMEARGAVEYQKGLNCRYMSKPFTLDGREIVFECSTNTKGRVYPSIYETHDGGCYGNPGRMEAAGYWTRYEYGYKVVVDALPEYSKPGMIQALTAIYPELKNDITRIIFID